MRRKMSEVRSGKQDNWRPGLVGNGEWGAESGRKGDTRHRGGGGLCVTWLANAPGDKRGGQGHNMQLYAININHSNCRSHSHTQKEKKEKDPGRRKGHFRTPVHRLRGGAEAGAGRGR